MSLQTWASSSSHHVLQIYLAAVSSLLQQRVIKLEVTEEAGHGWERGHTEGREGVMLWAARGEQARWREGLVRLDLVSEPLVGAAVEGNGMDHWRLNPYCAPTMFPTMTTEMSSSMAGATADVCRAGFSLCWGSGGLKGVVGSGSFAGAALEAAHGLGRASC